MKKIKYNAIVIFGSNSFISQNLLLHKNSKKYQFYFISRNNKKKTEQSFNYNQLKDLLNIINYSDYKKIFVINLANSSNFSDYLEKKNNKYDSILKHQNLIINFCLKIKLNYKHIYISSDKVFGKKNSTAFPYSKQKPIDPYGKFKFFNENKLRNIIDQNLIIVRVTNIYGPGQKNNQFIPSVIRQIKQSNLIKVGNTNSYRDYIYISDVVNGIYKIIENSNNLNVYHFSNKKIKLTNILKKIKILISKEFNRNLSIVENLRLKRPLKYEIGKFKLFKQTTSLHLAWKPKINIEEGLKKIIKYEFKKYKKRY